MKGLNEVPDEHPGVFFEFIYIDFDRVLSLASQLFPAPGRILDNMRYFPALLVSLALLAPVLGQDDVWLSWFKGLEGKRLTYADLKQDNGRSSGARV